MKLMDISEVAKHSGVPASTLRYYEEQGLITSIGRRGLRRLFGPEILQQLSLIALGQTAGFSLGEIAGMFGANGEPSLSRAELHAKADELDRTVQRLSALSDGLRHAADCPAPTHMECPTFRRLLDIAARRKATGHRTAP